jgi:hypothetical protein
MVVWKPMMIRWKPFYGQQIFQHLACKVIILSWSWLLLSFSPQELPGIWKEDKIVALPNKILNFVENFIQCRKFLTEHKICLHHQ